MRVKEGGEVSESECVCVCVREREIERERESTKNLLKNPFSAIVFFSFDTTIKDLILPCRGGRLMERAAKKCQLCSKILL